MRRPGRRVDLARFLLQSRDDSEQGSSKGGIFMRRKLAAALALAGIFCLAGAFPGSAQEAKPPQTNQPVYMALGKARAIYYRPAAGPAPHVAFLAIHRTADFLQHPSCLELPKRGFAALCMNTRFEDSEFDVNWDRLALDVKAGMDFLRKQPGIDKIILFAHSGGGPTLSFYEAVAENGIAYCQDPHRLWPCRGDLAGLPRADAIVFADAHPGTSVTSLRNLNGAIVDETPGRFDPALDPFNPANGYNPSGESNYSPAFQKRYFAAQSRRMNRLIDSALDRMAAIREGHGPYPDNDVLVIPDGGNPGAGPGGTSQLWSFDTNLAQRSTAEPRKLLRNDGSIVTEIVKSVGAPDLKSARETRAFDTGTKVLSLVSFLSANAIRSTNSFDGIDYCSSNSSTICAVRSIAVPVLVMGMGEHYFIRDSENEYEQAKSADKDLIYIEGSTHFFTPCGNCAKPASAYANVRKNLFDYVAKWTNARFGKKG
jgi:pimeloyl-ACP methyl ester carboxylesterase